MESSSVMVVPRYGLSAASPRSFAHANSQSSGILSMTQESASENQLPLRLCFSEITALATVSRLAPEASSATASLSM